MKTILRNANIYTMNDQQPIAKIMIYENEKIVYIGNDDSVAEAHMTTATQTYDLKGRTIIPGLIDSHVHPGAVSQSSWHIRAPWTEDREALLQFVENYAKEHPVEEIPFLYFEYYPTSMFDKNGPRKELLDKVVSDRPCLIQDFGEHMHWVNSKMLELLEVDKNTPDPIPGLAMFVRDKNGEPTGWVKEKAWGYLADRMYEKIGWKPPVDFTPEAMLPFYDFMLNHGITALSDGYIINETQVDAQNKLYEQGKIKLYYDGMVRFNNMKELPEKIAELRKYEKGIPNKYITMRTMKLFLDGTNESGNCAVIEPFFKESASSPNGALAMEKDELVECLKYLNTERIDLHIHVVGDRGFRVACDAYEQAKNQVVNTGDSWNIQMVLAHCELVHPDDMKRPAELGININWTCHWAGGYFGDEAKEYLGEERWNIMYQFNPMIESGAQVAFSSDVVTFYELNRAAPFFGMQVAQTRIDPEVPLDSSVYPGSMRPSEDAKLSVDVLLKGYTLNGAKQMHLDGVMGSLEKGKLANFVVLSEDPYNTEPKDFSKIESDIVVFEGQIVKGTI